MLTLDDGDRHIRASIDKVKLYKMKGRTAAKPTDDHLDRSSTLVAIRLPSQVDADETDTHAGLQILAPDNDYLLDKPLETETIDHLADRSGHDELLDVMEGIQDAEAGRTRISDALDHVPSDVAYIGVHITEVLHPGDPRGETKPFETAKLAEINGLKARKVWKVISRSKIPKDANILGGRFVLAIKNLGSSDQKEKARDIVQGHKDKEKPYMVHEIATLRSSSIRLVLSVAAIQGFRIFSLDVNQAYVQSRDKMTRRIFILPKQEDLDIIGITEDELLQLLRPLYGVCDAGDYWGVTIHFHAERDLGMTPSLGDPALYLSVSDGELEGLMAIYVDDIFTRATKNSSVNP